MLLTQYRRNSPHDKQALEPIPFDCDGNKPNKITLWWSRSHEINTFPPLTSLIKQKEENNFEKNQDPNRNRTRKKNAFVRNSNGNLFCKQKHPMARRRCVLTRIVENNYQNTWWDENVLKIPFHSEIQKFFFMLAPFVLLSVERSLPMAWHSTSHI